MLWRQQEHAAAKRNRLPEPRCHYSGNQTILKSRIFLHCRTCFASVQRHVTQSKCLVHGRQSLIISSQHPVLIFYCSIPVYYTKRLFLPLKVASPNKWCSTKPIWATTISKTSLHIVLVSQVSSSFCPLRSITFTFRLVSSFFPFFVCIVWNKIS